MTAEQISLVSAIAGILQTIGTWPIGLCVIMVVLGPWIINLFISRSQDRRAAEHDKHSAVMVATIKEEFACAMSLFEKRFEAVVVMYEKNVTLVENHEKMADDLIETIRLNTQVLTQLAERIRQ